MAAGSLFAITGSNGRMSATRITATDGFILPPEKSINNNGSYPFLTLTQGTGAQSNSTVLSLASDFSFILGGGFLTKDWDHGAQTNPTLFVHSATNPDTANDEWTSLTHDATNGVIATGSGDLILQPTSGNVGIGTTDPLAPLDVTTEAGGTGVKQVLQLGGAEVYFNSNSSQVRLGQAGQLFSVSGSNRDLGTSSFPWSKLYLSTSLDLASAPINTDLTTEDEGFIDFQATIDADATSAISSLTTSGTVTHHIQVKINGTTAWIPCSTTDPT